MNINTSAKKMLAVALSFLSVSGGIGANAMAPAEHTKKSENADSGLKRIKFMINLYDPYMSNSELDLLRNIKGVDDLYTLGILKKAENREYNHTREYWDEDITKEILRWIEDKGDHGIVIPGFSELELRYYRDLLYARKIFGENFFVNRHIWDAVRNLLVKAFNEPDSLYCVTNNRIDNMEFWSENIKCILFGKSDKQQITRKRLLTFIIFILLSSEGQLFKEDSLNKDYLAGRRRYNFFTSPSQMIYNYPRIPKDIIVLPLTQNEFIAEDWSNTLERLSLEEWDKLVNFLPYYFATVTFAHHKMDAYIGKKDEIYKNKMQYFSIPNIKLLRDWVNSETVEEYNRNLRDILECVKMFATAFYS